MVDVVIDSPVFHNVILATFTFAFKLNPRVQQSSLSDILIFISSMTKAS